MTLRELRRHLAAPEVQSGVASADLVTACVDPTGARVVIWRRVPDLSHAVSAYEIIVPNTEDGRELAIALVNQIKATHPDARSEEVSCAA